jgi:hypothetical protein
VPGSCLEIIGRLFTLRIGLAFCLLSTRRYHLRYNRFDSGSGWAPVGSPVFKIGGGSRCGPRWVRLPSTPASLGIGIVTRIGELIPMNRRNHGLRHLAVLYLYNQVKLRFKTINFGKQNTRKKRNDFRLRASSS